MYTYETRKLNFKWNQVEGEKFFNDLNTVYDKIVYWKKNLFLLPSGHGGKQYVKELTRIINSWTNNSPLRTIAMKAIHVMPALLLQKPSKKSKSKDHMLALERRLKLWDEGNLLELLAEGTTIQDRITSSNRKSDISAISKKFKLLMQKGDVNAALKLLTNNMNNGILPLNDDTLILLEEKHPEASEVQTGILLDQPPERIHPIVYDAIDEDLIFNVASLTKGGSGPSGMDAEGWRRILCSSMFGTTNGDLRKALAEMIKRLCIEELPCDSNNTTSVEAFIACRMIPLNKNPGLRPIGVGEVLRRIAGKAIMRISKNDVMRSVGPLQLCAGQEAGAEAAIHAMHDIFNDNETEAVLLIDAENAFNSINRKAMIHNISILCPIISTFIKNCYNIPARLFIIGGKELLSREGTTQGDPTAMAAYAIGMTPLLMFLFEYITSNNNTTKHVAFADDFTVAGKIHEIKDYWDSICNIGPKYGYFPKPEKSYLIVKDDHLLKVNDIFKHSNVKITSTGQRYLGAVIGSLNYKNKFVNEKINSMVNQLSLLSKIAEIEPQAAYGAFVVGFKSKLNYLLRTIPDISINLHPFEEIIRNEFISQQSRVDISVLTSKDNFYHCQLV